jgi:ribose/xylose/arabinose/galactoside ABC-type transport system permease subunit
MTATTPQAPRVLPGRGGKRISPRTLAGELPLIAIVIAFVVFAISTHNFATWQNVKAVLSAASIVGIIAIGLTLVTISGSLVSLATASTAVACAMAFLGSLKLGLVVSVLIAVATGTAITAVQGLLVGLFEANPIILTIGASFLIDGITQNVNGGATIQPATSAYASLNDTWLGFPISVYVMVVLGIVLQFVLRRSALGRQMYLVGDSRPAARAAGLPVTGIIVIAFAIAGAAMALGGIFLGAFNDGASQALEGTLSFDVVAAVLVGGTLISGGRGSALRTLAGAVAIAAIQNMLLLRGLGSGPQTMVEGLLVVVVVLLSHVRSGYRGE